VATAHRTRSISLNKRKKVLVFKTFSTSWVNVKYLSYCFPDLCQILLWYLQIW